MDGRAKVVKQFLLLLMNVGGDEVRIKDIEMVLKNGAVAGIKLEIAAKERPKLELVKDIKKATVP